MTDDPCDDWWPWWTDYRKPFLRYPTGLNYDDVVFND